MKTIFIPTKIKSQVNSQKILSLSKKLPKNLAIAYSIQYQDIAKEIKKILSKGHKITGLTQVLGCSKPKFPKSTQAVLLISSGKFHAIPLAYETKLPTYILYNNQLTLISKKDIENLGKKKKASYMKFLNSKDIGILVSTKPGQENLKKALTLKNKLKDKKAYLFISDDLNLSEFENFSLDSWINTACKRLDMGNSSVINVDEINKHILQ